MKTAEKEDRFFPDKYFIKKPPEFTKAMAGRRHQAMNVLLRMTKIIGNHSDMDLSLSTMMDLAAEIVPYDWGLFYLWDDDTGSLQMKASRGFDKSIPILLEKGNLVACWTYEHSKPINISQGAD